MGNPKITNLTSLWCCVRMLVEKVVWGPLSSITGLAWLGLKRYRINSSITVRKIMST